MAQTVPVAGKKPEAHHLRSLIPQQLNLREVEETNLEILK